MFMFPIDPSFFFNTPITYYGSEDAEEEFEEDDLELPPPLKEIDLFHPTLNGTGIYLHWFDT